MKNMNCVSTMPEIMPEITDEAIIEALFAQRPYEEKVINSAFLEIPAEYQRKLNIPNVEKMSAEFTELIANPPKVSYRDGHYFVFDGQHTIVTRRAMNGGQDLPIICKVYEGLTEEEEAMLFSRQTGVSTPLTAGAELRAALVGKDPESLAFVKATESTGLQLGLDAYRAPWKIICIRTAFIIMMNDLVSTRTALAEHHRAAHSAEQLGGEQVIVLGLVTGRSAAVLLDFLLHFFKQVLVHDGRDAVGHYDVLEVVFTDVPFVRQQLLNTVVGKLLIAVGGHATVVQPVHQFFHGRALIVPPEGFYHKGSFQRVDLKELLLVHLEANGNRAAVVLAFQHILSHAAHNFFRKLCRVVFSHAGEHTLDHDTRRAVRDRLRGRYQLDMISFQLVLIVGRIITVSSKTVKFPDQHNVKQPLFAVFDHLLEVRAVVGFGGERTVNIVLDDRDAVLFRISSAFPNLAFNGFLTLVVR